MILANESLELLLQPGTFNLLRSIFKINWKLQYLCMITFRWTTVGIPSVFIIMIILLTTIPSFLFMHRLLELMVEFTLLTSLIILGDKIECNSEVRNCLIIIHIKKECFCSNKMSFLPGFGRNDGTMLLT